MYQDIVAGESSGHLVGETNSNDSDESNNYFKPSWMRKKEYGFLVLIFSALAAGFGNSLEPVSMLIFAHIFLLLTGFETSLENDSFFSWDSFKLYGFVIITQALGFCLGFVGMLGYPKTDASTVFACIGLGILLWICFVFLAILPHFMYCRKYSTSVTSIFLFPVLYTVVYCTVLGNSFSTFAALGNAALDYAPLRQFATFFGIYGINFLVTLLGSFPAFVVSRYNHISKFELRKFRRYYSRGFVITFIIMGFLIQSKYLYQVHIPKLTPQKVPVSCVFAQTTEFNSANYYQLWNSTQKRVEAGDGIILMAEEAMHLRSTDQQNEAIQLAITLAKLTPSSTGVLIGITYLLELPGEELCTNQFVLVSNQQDTPLWNYKKAHPVPLVESNVRAGPPELPYAHTNYGYLSGAICFDLDFPQYIADAGRNQVDLFLQPSWTWNAINFRHFEGDAIRAIENGFTLFRCSSDGESGIVDPYGKFLARQYTSHYPTDISLFQLPLNSRVTTFYPYFGFIIEYVLVVSAFFYYLSIYVNLQEKLYNIFDY